ncbi:MAG TPA: glutathione peroxidase [Solirubrobacteraceae bacterium]|nr:glutathione peroxidase [Solirubrobacteraceae bacterium]
MRLMCVVGMVLLALAGLAVSGCGSSEGSDTPAASTSTTVQPAVAESDAEAAAPPGADHSREREGTGGVLNGTFTRLNGERDDLSAYRGKVALVVNTATACGYTPQFESLEALYRARRADGFVVLGFPANDFAGQEPRSDKEIAEFCKANYGVTFPMFSKTAVTGDDANPLFRRLSAAAGAPEWNFNKYLVDRRGKVVARFGAGTEPDASELKDRLEKLL